MNRDFFKIDRKALAIIVKHSVKMYAKTRLKLYVPMTNSRLPTNFQLGIFVFEARVSLQSLLQSLKQKSRKSALAGNVPK